MPIPHENPTPLPELARFGLSPGAVRAPNISAARADAFDGVQLGDDPSLSLPSLLSVEVVFCDELATLPPPSSGGGIACVKNTPLRNGDTCAPLDAVLRLRFGDDCNAATARKAACAFDGEEGGSAPKMPDMPELGGGTWERGVEPESWGKPACAGDGERRKAS